MPVTAVYVAVIVAFVAANPYSEAPDPRKPGLLFVLLPLLFFGGYCAMVLVIVSGVARDPSGNLETAKQSLATLEAVIGVFFMTFLRVLFPSAATPEAIPE
ncbi:hypothetical protein QM565_27320 [Geitlerinema splendidum]|nr:hypothetical protein [Geitlerinema splendidum]